MFHMPLIIGDHMRAIVYLISDGEKLLNEKLAERGVASGIWCIEAVAGEAFIEHVNTRDFYKEQLCSTLKVKSEEVTTRVENLFMELRLARNENSALRAKAAVYKALVIASKAILVGNTKQYR
ncbi:hypothetical protein L6164_037688 [Bauhinia variegata]|uniref:Uncharacterized protein n=1 Tax=Bauhinia variegata TaxID=167791 RepID=A0ACB9KKY6_BAUVA|nr:hypothetical protein L6164_037688 [Bauhinia variegata]